MLFLALTIDLCGKGYWLIPEPICSGGVDERKKGNWEYKDKFYLLYGYFLGTNLEKKVMTNLDSILKSRDISLPTKVHLVKAVVFPVIMYGCESWTKRKLSTEELMLLNYGV